MYMTTSWNALDIATNMLSVCWNGKHLASLTAVAFRNTFHKVTAIIIIIIFTSISSYSTQTISLNVLKQAKVASYKYSFYFWLTFYNPSRDSVVGIATGYGMDDRGVGVRVPVESRIFSSPRRPDRLWGPPNLLSNGYRGLFHRG